MLCSANFMKWNIIDLLRKHLEPNFFIGNEKIINENLLINNNFNKRIKKCDILHQN